MYICIVPSFIKYDFRVQSQVSLPSEIGDDTKTKLSRVKVDPQYGKTDSEMGTDCSVWRVVVVVVCGAMLNVSLRRDLEELSLYSNHQELG